MLIVGRTVARSPAGKAVSGQVATPKSSRAVAKSRLLAVIDGPASRNFRPSTLATLSLGLGHSRSQQHAAFATGAAPARYVQSGRLVQLCSPRDS